MSDFDPLKNGVGRYATNSAPITLPDLVDDRVIIQHTTDSNRSTLEWLDEQVKRQPGPKAPK